MAPKQTETYIDTLGAMLSEIGSIEDPVERRERLEQFLTKADPGSQIDACRLYLLCRTHFIDVRECPYIWQMLLPVLDAAANVRINQAREPDTKREYLFMEIMSVAALSEFGTEPVSEEQMLTTIAERENLDATELKHAYSEWKANQKQGQTTSKAKRP